MLTSASELTAPIVWDSLNHEITTLQRLLNCLPSCPTPETRQELQRRISNGLKQISWYLLNHTAALANNAARFTDLFGRITLIMRTLFRLTGHVNIIQKAGYPVFAIPFTFASIIRIIEVATTSSSTSSSPQKPTKNLNLMMNGTVGIAMIAWIIAAVELLSTAIFSDSRAIAITSSLFSIAASRNLLKMILDFLRHRAFVQTNDRLLVSLTTLLAILDSIVAEGLSRLAEGASIFAAAMLTFINIFYNGPRPPEEAYDPMTLTIIAFAVGGITGLFAILLKERAPAVSQSLLTIFAMFHSTFGAANLIVLGTSLTIPEITEAITFSAHETQINQAFISLALFTSLGNILRGLRRYHNKSETPIYTSFALPKRAAYMPPESTSISRKIMATLNWSLVTLLYIIVWGFCLLTGFNEAFTIYLPRRSTNHTLEEPLLPTETDTDTENQTL